MADPEDGRLLQTDGILLSLSGHTVPITRTAMFHDISINPSISVHTFQEVLFHGFIQLLRVFLLFAPPSSRASENAAGAAPQIDAVP